MKVLNYGSLNVDFVYSLDHIVQEGETILSSSMEAFCGGKGLNQSIAMAKAGCPVWHAGLVGEDGQMLLDALKNAGVNIQFVEQLPVKNGHAIIQVDETGQNSIILYGGTNQMQTKERIDQVLSAFEEGDTLVLQNEVNLIDYLIDRASEKGMRIVLNPSPYDEKLENCDLSKISLFILNEVEGEQITGIADPDSILLHLKERFPKAQFILTLGSKGAVWYDGNEKVFQDIFPVKAVDTTAAGDTFTGFVLAGMLEGKSMQQALRLAAKASSIAVTRAGAVPSIPTREEVEEGLKES